MYRSISTVEELIKEGPTYIHKGKAHGDANCVVLTRLDGEDCDGHSTTFPHYRGAAKPHQFYRGGGSPLHAAVGPCGDMAWQLGGAGDGAGFINYSGGPGLSASRLGGMKKGGSRGMFWEHAGAGARVGMAPRGGYVASGDE